MRLSIAMATYNGERYVAEQLASIAAQGRQPDEVCIFDDASGDETRRIVKREIEGRAGWSLTARSENVGYRRNFYEAIAACTGDVIFLCDQDDVWHADKLARFEAFFESHPEAQAVVSDYALVDAGLAPIPGAEGARFCARYPVKEDGRLALFRTDPLLWAHGSVAPGCCMAVRRTVAERYLQSSRCEMPHDWEMAMIADAADGLYALDAVLTDYRQHGGNAIGLATGAQPLRMRGTMEKRLEVHGHFEGVTRVTQTYASERADEALLARMHGYCRARRAFLLNPCLRTLLPVYRYGAIYRRAIDSRGRMGDAKLALTHG